MKDENSLFLISFYFSVMTKAKPGFTQVTTREKDFEYYKPEDCRIWQAPADVSKWNKRLAEIGGHCPFGDQRLRLVWGATEETDGYIQADWGSIPARIRKYPVGGVSKIQKLLGYDYIDRQTGKKHFVSRADRVPKGCFSLPRYEHIHLGVLRWVFERKFTVPELVAGQLRPDPMSAAGKTYGVDGGGRRYIAPTNPRGEYIMLYPLQTPSGGYFEPDTLWFDGLRKVQMETELSQAEKSKLLGQTLERFQKEDEGRERAENDELIGFVENSIVEAEKEAINKVMQKRGHRTRHGGRG